ncbi:MAG: hypothetical protein R3E42_18820 [Burkholderiaceae bacterium]
MNEDLPRATRSQRAMLFRQRLNEAMQAQWLNRSSLAERAGVDRSTISLLLSEQQVRLPSGHWWQTWPLRSTSRRTGCSG